MTGKTAIERLLVSSPQQLVALLISSSRTDLSRVSARRMAFCRLFLPFVGNFEVHNYFQCIIY